MLRSLPLSETLSNSQYLYSDDKVLKSVMGTIASIGLSVELIDSPEGPVLATAGGGAGRAVLGSSGPQDDPGGFGSEHALGGRGGGRRGRRHAAVGRCRSTRTGASAPSARRGRGAGIG